MVEIKLGADFDATGRVPEDLDGQALGKGAGGQHLLVTAPTVVESDREDDALLARINKEAGGPALVNDQDVMAMIQALGGLFE